MILNKKNIQFTVKLDNRYNESERSAIAQEIIDYIKTQTAKGKSPITGKSFNKYSSAYKNSLDFKNAKGSSSKVNLRLSGDMIASIGVLENKDGSLIIGYDESDSEAEKAEGNQIGSYGNSHGSKKLAKPFIGIKKDALEFIKNKYPLNDEAKRTLRTAQTQGIIDVAQDTTTEFLNAADFNVTED